MSYTSMQFSQVLLGLFLLFNSLTIASAQAPSIEDVADQFDKNIFWPQEIGEQPIVYYFDSIQNFERRADFLQTVYTNLEKSSTDDSTSQLALDIREFARQELSILKSCQPGVWDFGDFHAIYDFFSILQSRIEQTNLTLDDSSILLQGLQNLSQLLESANSRLQAALSAQIYPPATSVIFWTDHVEHWMLGPSAFQEFVMNYTTLCKGCKPSDSDQYMELYEQLITPQLIQFSQLIEEIRPLSQNLVSLVPSQVSEPCITQVIANVGMSSRTPKEILELGLRELKRAEQNMYKIVAKQNSYSLSVPDELKAPLINNFLDEIILDPNQYSLSSDEYLKFAREVQERAITFLPKISDYSIPIPKIVDLELQAESFPGGMYNFWEETVYLNSPTPVANYQLAQVMAHEGLPGHHLERSISMGSKGPNSFEQHYHGDESVIEGWSFYMEEYMDEIGFYQSDLERLSYLEDIRVRALRLILPYRIFFDNWTLEDARAYSEAHSSMPEWRLSSELQRNSHWRGQVLNYMVGKEDILDMKKTARKTLGVNYTDQAFHTFILSPGDAHPRSLKILFKNWLQSQ